ncbi:DNA repair protein RecO [Candidatus Magnetoovum chiemensis]|nr:DNA repair protein RecO [Candidatus Magnetoovum chiemensis]
MDSFSTDAILLRRVEYGDHDLIISYFTRSMGKLSVIAKNAKKSVRRFAGALDPFISMNIECSYPKRKGNLSILNSVDIENPFANIRTSAAKTGYASYWLEMINLWMEEGKREEPLYNLTFDVLKSLNENNIPMEVLSLVFQIGFMKISGFSPDLLDCAECGISIDNIEQKKIIFDILSGRIICDKCRIKEPAKQSPLIVNNSFLVNEGGGHYFNKSDFHLPVKTITVSKGTLKQLYWISSTDIKQAERLKFSPFSVREGENLLEQFIPCHIGRSMKSLNFLHRIRNADM